MALSGIQIYKLLPQTNCKECGFPTCLAFAMKLAAKQVELSSCPYVTEESKTQLAESSAPPIRLISIKSKDREFKVGNEVVLFRHEKTFYNKPGLFIKIDDNWSSNKIKEYVTEIDHYVVNYVGIELKVDGLLVESTGNSPEKLIQALKIIRSISNLPLIISCTHKDSLVEGLKFLEGEHPLIYCADINNWEDMTTIAKQYQASLAVSSASLEEMSNLTDKIKSKGFEDIVLDPLPRNLSSNLALNVQIRRLALKKNYRPLGYPTMAFPENPEGAVQAIVKYTGIIVLQEFQPEIIYPLLVLRQNIYTDPQKPIQVQPGLYEINNPKPDSPVLVTTNFSITYFSVANEVEASGLPAWLIVTDAEGMSVLTAWAAGKFDSDRIAKSVKTFNVAEKVTRKLLVLPGHVAVLSGEVEAELPDWQVKVGPREAVDIPKFLKQVA